MKRTLFTCALTAALLIALDGLVAIALTRAEASGQFTSLVRYFEYGRSVPGKLARWEDNPELPGNLYDNAWRSSMIAESTARFTETTGPAIRSYGMSFVDHILTFAADGHDLQWDRHSGPGAPPNYTYALFEDDRANRRAGDIVVFGILSSSVPGMAALSNRTWAFEQPAPFTYPVYQLADGNGLRRIDPLVNSAAAQRALVGDSDAAEAWHRQLAEHDAFYAFASFGAPWLDRSPFVRLVRRSLATNHSNQTKAAIVAKNRYPHAEILQRMIAEFAATARLDGQIPIVMLIQSRDPADADLLAIAKPVLEQNNIPYLAAAEHFDLKNPANFVPDGHYTPDIDRMLSDRFLDLIGPLQ